MFRKVKLSSGISGQLSWNDPFIVSGLTEFTIKIIREYIKSSKLHYRKHFNYITQNNLPEGGLVCHFKHIYFKIRRIEFFTTGKANHLMSIKIGYTTNNC